MTAQPLTVALPPGRVFSDGDVITITAVDATSGAPVPGVTVGNVLLEVELLSGSASDLPSGLFTVVPVLIPAPSVGG